ncbi:hypothetical protein BDZ97DRAFT_1667602, partial [Flammula alnicola]
IRDIPSIVHRYYEEENYKTPIFPFFKLRDTPLRSLYRIHDAACADMENLTMLEGEFVWRHKEWRVEDIPDPKNPNPVRYCESVMLASR